MNFVKGILRRSSGPQEAAAAENKSTDSQAWADVQFSKEGSEAVLNRLWKDYQEASSEEESRKLFQSFVLRFIQVFEQWTPAVRSAGPSDGVCAGCSLGHPTRVVAGLVQQLKRTNDAIGELNATDGSSFNPDDMDAALSLLSAVAIVTRAPHNRTIFSFFGGLQTLTGLLKSSVVLVKGLCNDETSPSPAALVLLSFLKCLLAHIVSITASFITSGSVEQTEASNKSRRRRPSVTSGDDSAGNSTPLLETGGLIWFVELLRVLKKLRVRELATNTSLETLTLQTLKSSIASNARVQNHFKSIGGLEVLIDSLRCLPMAAQPEERDKVLEEFRLQLLSFEVTREAVFHNVNCLQSFREMEGALHCAQFMRWAATVLPDLCTADASSPHGDKQAGEIVKDANLQLSHLCRILYSFLVDTTRTSENAGQMTGLYWESATKLVVTLILRVFEDDEAFLSRLQSNSLQRNVLSILSKVLAISPPVLQLYREEGVWNVLFSKYFFYFRMVEEDLDDEPLQLQVISVLELAATSSAAATNLLECSTLIQALEQCIHLPSVAVMILKSLHRVLQLAPEPTLSSFRQLEVVIVLSEAMGAQLKELKEDENNEAILQERDATFALFNEYLLSSEDAKFVVLRSVKLMDVLFSLLCDVHSRSFAIYHISNFMKLVPSSPEDQDAKLEFCIKYLETLSRIQSEFRTAGISIISDLLSILRDVLESDYSYYQGLFREAECFVHIVSLINEVYPEELGQELCLDVIATLVHLLKDNESSKLAFRALVGPGYRMLQTLLIDRYQGKPTWRLLNAILEMLVDEKFESSSRMVIKNGDALILIFNIIRQSPNDVQVTLLDVVLKLLEDSSANQASAVNAGLLCLLMDWFLDEREEVLVAKLVQLMRLVGGYSMSGKEMRKIFSLLRTTADVAESKNLLLLDTFKSMLKEQGPSVYFENSGINSGISINKPLRWPTNKGYSFSCWVRLETVSRDIMGLFSFLTEDGKGCTALISPTKLLIETAGQKRQMLQFNISLSMKKWHFVCVTHSTGRALSSGSVIKTYVDGTLVGDEKLRYPKVYDPLTRCTIGATSPYAVLSEEDDEILNGCFSSPLCGQLGPIYLFDDALTPEQVEGVHMLGAGYMYSFLPSEIERIPLSSSSENSLFSSREGIASKMIIGLNAQASRGRILFNITASGDAQLEAAIMPGTQLCSRRLVQDNLQCVGGIGVFFPLLTHLQEPFLYSEMERVHDSGYSYVVDVVELLTAFLDKNFTNQKSLYNCNGLSLLGFLLQFVSFKQLSVKVIAALNSLLNVLAQAGDKVLAETLVKDAIINVYLNPSAWIYTPYVVQRELYLSLINFFDNYASSANVCGVARFLDMIQHFYRENKLRGRRSSQRVEDRPRQEELSQLRLLILSLAELSIRGNLTMGDTKALLSYIDRAEDVACLQDVLQTLLALLGDAKFASTFTENLHALEGIHVIFNVLKRPQEGIRLLGLHILGALVTTSQGGKRTSRVFGFKVIHDQNEGKTRDASMWRLLCERLLLFPFTPALRIVLFDILLGGLIPRMVLQGSILTQFGKTADKRNWVSQLQAISSPLNANVLPQINVPSLFGVIVRCVHAVEDPSMKQSIVNDLLTVVDASPSNCDLVLQETGWQEWFVGDALAQREDVPGEHKLSLRKLLCALHSHAVCSIRGGWHHIERTFAYVYMNADQKSTYADLLVSDLVADLLEDVLKGRPPHEAVSVQPCRDNVLFVLSLVDEYTCRQSLHLLPCCSTEEDNDLLSGDYVDLGSEPRKSNDEKSLSDFNKRLYDNVWTLICAVNGKGRDGSSSLPGPSLGQRARGLVESLNVPAAEMAAAVTGGLGSVGITISTKSLEKALKLRGEKFIRLTFRLLLLYLYKADLDATMSAVRQFLLLLPSFLLPDTEQTRGQLHLLLRCLLDAREQIGTLDAGARYHVVSQLIQEVLDMGKGVLITTLADKGRLLEAVSRDPSSVYGLLLQEKVVSAVKDEKKFLRQSQDNWLLQVATLRSEMNDSCEFESQDLKLIQEQAQATSAVLLQFESNRRAAYKLKRDEEQQVLANQWSLMLRNLTDERGPWSSVQFPDNTPKNWKLDKTEDPLRRRIKLKRNYHCDQKLSLPPLSSTSNPETSSLDKKLYGRKLSNSFKALFDQDYEEPEEEDEMQDAKDTFTQENEERPMLKDDDAIEGKQNTSEDEVVLSVCCVLVSAKRKLAGRLEVARRSLHFHLSHVVEGTGGSMVFDKSGGFCQDANDSGNQSNVEIFSSGILKQHRKWDLSQITAIHASRYLLQYTALEFFFANSAPPIFLNFPSQQTAKDVAVQICNGSGRGKDMARIHYVDKKKALELAERAKDCWRRRECSNFEYLMILNTLGGRSHNDLTQYPVVPWVLSDYTSDVLDIYNPSVYRDLSKPIGVLDEKRFQVFQERYDNFSDPDIPSFYYGSHYSSMGIVLFYLLRLEPFTSLHRALQGGKFDHADRLFHSVEAAYANCLTNTSDVKELIPEFFYMPEFFTNMNKHFIGVKQDGQAIDDVVLPAWAKGSPEEFIRLNREALESEHVSDNLHRWIDLIFGCKQRGRLAVEVANVFYYLTYEGAVELESISDVRQRAAIEDQIANFGQTPIQLFRKRHPRRGPAAPILRPLYYSPASITLSSSISSRHLSIGLIDKDPPLLFLAHNDGKIVAITSEMVASVRLWLTPLVQGGGSFTFSSSQDFTFGLGQEVWPPHKIGGHFATESADINPSCFQTLQANSSMYLLTSGYWDNSFKVISLSDGRMIQSVSQHKDVVTCVSVSADGTTVATGSRDTTVMVWEVVLSSRKQRNSKNNPIEAIVSDRPRHVLCGHDDVVTSVVVRSELDIVVSGSADGTCILHTLRQGRYVRSLVYPSSSSSSSSSRCTISSLAVSQHGSVLVYSADDLHLHVFSVNGKHLSQAELNCRLNCLELSSCGEYVVYAGEQGQIFLRKLHSLQLLHRYDSISGSHLTSLCLTPEDCFLVGTGDGKLYVFSVETTPRRASLGKAGK